MEPNSREFYKQCAFQKFCNTVLHNEACDTHRELRRHKAKEVTFSDMTLDEARQLHTFDEYFKREAAETVFEKAGKKITPKLLLEATLKRQGAHGVWFYIRKSRNLYPTPTLSLTLTVRGQGVGEQRVVGLSYLTAVPGVHPAVCPRSDPVGSSGRAPSRPASRTGPSVPVPCVPSSPSASRRIRPRAPGTPAMGATAAR